MRNHHHNKHLSTEFFLHMSEKTALQEDGKAEEKKTTHRPTISPGTQNYEGKTGEEA